MYIYIYVCMYMEKMNFMFQTTNQLTDWAFKSQHPHTNLWILQQSCFIHTGYMLHVYSDPTIIKPV